MWIVRKVTKSDVILHAAETMTECLSWAMSFIGDGMIEDLSFLHSADRPAIYLSNNGKMGSKTILLCIQHAESWHDLSQVL